MTKSEKEGPELRRSVKAVARRGSVAVEEGGGGVSTVVAKLRFCGIERHVQRESRRPVDMRRQVGVRREAMVAV